MTSLRRDSRHYPPLIPAVSGGVRAAIDANGMRGYSLAAGNDGSSQSAEHFLNFQRSVVDDDETLAGFDHGCTEKRGVWQKFGAGVTSVTLV